MTATAAAVETNRVKIPPAYYRVWQSRRPYQIWYGGRGSAKSWTKAIYFLAKAETQAYCRTIFARDTQKNVRNSQYQLFKDITKRFPYFRDKFDFFDSTMKIVCKRNGNLLTGGSFEQPDTLRSVADPTDFWAEEPITRESEIKRQDFFDIVGSLRNSYGIQTQFHLTFNPISKQAWIYKDFFETQLYDCETLFVNYWDNPFCPEPLKTFLESLKTLDPKRYRVDALGEWGVSYEGLIYPDYESVKEMPEPMFYGLDFGYNDPCALVAGAVRDTPNQDKKDYFVAELLYETKHTSETLIKRFESIGVKKNLRMICDNARPEMIADLVKAGYRAEPCQKYKGSVADGINEVKKYNLKILSGSRNLFDEIATYCWKADNETLLDEPEDSVNHALDAMRYALESQKKSSSGSLEFEDWL
jgi:phage terminase large subunit